jgi:pectinesterase
MNFLINTILCLVISKSIFAQKIIVSKNGTTPYSTIQSAIDAVPINSEKQITIYVKKGIYKEVVKIDSNKNNILLIGENAKNTIITFDNHTGTKLPNGEIINTRTSASVFINGNNFTAKNISFENNAGFNAGQAVAVKLEGDKGSFYNCNFFGFQDVLFLNGHHKKYYFKKCYIEGTTDFIFGESTALFEKCTIHSKKNSHVTAASTPPDVKFGFVFLKCTLTADTGLYKVSLGRPWSPTASVTYIHCTIGKHILPEGWNNWKNPANEATARYAEYKNTDEGANILNRVKWCKQLTSEEAKEYTKGNVLSLPKSLQRRDLTL